MTAEQAKKATIKAREKLIQKAVNEALKMIKIRVKAATSHGQFSCVIIRGSLIRLSDPILYNLADRKLMKVVDKLNFAVMHTQDNITLHW